MEVERIAEGVCDSPSEGILKPSYVDVLEPNTTREAWA